MRKLAESLRKHKRRWFAAVVVLLVLGPYLTSRALSPTRRVRVISSAGETGDPPQPSAEATVRVAAYNIAHGRGPIDDNWAEAGEAKPARVERIAAFLKGLRADVVVLNEVDFNSTWSGHHNQAAAIAEAAGYPYRVEQRNLDFRLLYGSWKFGNAILSRFPIERAELVDFPAWRTWEDWLAGHKRGVVATLRIDDKRVFRLLAVHLESRDEAARVASARRIIELAGASSTPLVAAGDFNSTPAPGLAWNRTAGGENAMRILTASTAFHGLPRRADDPQALSYPSGAPERAIDWILIPQDWSYVEHRAISADLSDHRPVVATIRWP